jgi:energy-coupling factor transport system substrate-specific component
MKFKIGIKEVVAMGIGTALFVVLTNAQIPLIVVPNTALQPRMAILAFLSAVFGPIVGAVVGLLGHALGDALFYGSVWWSWVIPEGVVGLCIGLFVNKFAVKEGGFVNGKNIILFNVVQIVANAIAWILVAPVLDILMFAEPANKVFAQGALAFVGNIVVIGILGTILLAAYSKISGKSSDLKVEE